MFIFGLFLCDYFFIYGMSNLSITRQAKDEELFNFLWQCKSISYPCLFIKDKTEKAIIVLIFNIFFS